VANLHFEQLLKNTQTRTLTTGVDAVVGSAGDDTITAPATVATTGAAQTTINSGDSIDGGAGTGDSLTITITAANNNSLTGLTIANVEKVSYVGSDNLGAGAGDTAAATTAKTAADAASLAAGAAAIAAAQVNAAYTAVKALTETQMKAVADLTTSPSANYTIAQYKAAAIAARSASDGTTLDTGTAVDDSTAMQARATVLETAANTANTTAAAALVTAAAAAATAAAKLTGAVAAQAAATIAAPADATSITIDGVNTTVSSLKDTQTVTVAASSAANTLKYASTATVANLGLTSATGTFTFADSSTTTASKLVATANVTGSVKGGTAGATTGSTPGTVTLVDSMNGNVDATTDTIKKLTLGITSDATIAVGGLTALTSIDGAASTGGTSLTGVLATTLNITTGSGADTVTFNAATDATDAKKLTSSLSTGAGNDKITVSVTGTGTSTVNAGAGDDSVTMVSALGTAAVDGGDGKDTLAFDATLNQLSFSTGGYNSLKANALNFEVLSMAGTAATFTGTTTKAETVIGAGATVDAAKAAQFTEFTFNQAANEDAAITKVADTQTVNAQGDVAVTAAGYVGKNTADANGDTALATAYAGTLTIAAKGEGQKFATLVTTNATTTADNANLDITANATALNLNVSTKGSTTNGVTTSTATTVVLTGDVKTATITVNNSANNSKLNSADVASKVTLAPNDELVAAGGAFKGLGNLTSVTVSGTGSAVIDNSDANNTTATLPGTKLATIDASGLAGKVTVAGTTLGDATAGLTWTAGLLTETVKLGSAIDKLNVSATTSTYAKMDSITGFSLVLNAAGVMDAASALKSDDITIGGANATFIKAATGFSTTSLDAALNTLANRDSAGTDKVVFQCAGNTYIFIDAATSTTAGVADGDMVIELVGLVDIDALIYALGTNV
jgi:S-layer protein